MVKVYTFFKVYEMNELVKVSEVVAYDLHSAIAQAGSPEYDLLAINGEWV